MEINLGCGDGTMAEEFLNVFDVDAFLQQQRGEGMAKDVGSDGTLNSGQFRVLCHDIAGGLGGELLAVSV